jgi:hypothetical protein
MLPVVSNCELFFVGLLAGIELGVHYGIGAPPSSLSGNAQIVIRQAIIRRLRILAPAIFLPAITLATLIAFEERHEPGSQFRLVTVGMLSVWVFIRFVRTFPVNSATLEWNPENPPSNWRSQIERTERFHVVAAWAAVLAFLCSLASMYELG